MDRTEQNFIYKYRLEYNSSSSLANYNLHNEAYMLMYRQFCNIYIHKEVGVGGFFLNNLHNTGVVYFH
jgi:hypothetical protein